MNFICICTYIHFELHHFAVTCTPACQNGGACRGNSSYTYCDCPKKYTGPHCENRGTATHSQRAGGPGNMQMVVSYLQPVNVIVEMEEHVLVHPRLLTVTVPVVTRDPTARNEVTGAHPGILMRGRSFGMKTLHEFVVYINLQTVVQPVRTEERAMIYLSMLTVTVPVGTQDPIARTEVCIGSCTYVHTYVRSYICF